jgi:glycerol-3-phosphate O-acyltransferase
MVVSYVFLLCGLSVPFIAAGDNLMIPIAGHYLRSAGAFFIKRKMEGDILYKALFNEYISAVMQEGYNLEFFLEGGRSRTGGWRVVDGG